MVTGFGEQYFRAPEDDGQSRKENSLKEKYEGVLNSKGREESMVGKLLTQRSLMH